ncbi:Hypothetical protein, putative [Bodo saltans]|uniref:Uncharacterized protein n=1 Tax=Bodo saltans TaxID=75058 RepID=A0A0S4JQC9_BODSA|nr:Hypothetical protein, putative [Bodo saltans]|eukprot:CUG92383.1 Hypothetical protein, putative [Bodo saltans]
MLHDERRMTTSLPQVSSSPSTAAAPAPAAAVVVVRPEGRNAVYVLYPFSDLATVAFSIDHGWIGLTDSESIEELLSQHQSAGDEESSLAPLDLQKAPTTLPPQVVVIAVVHPGIVVGYGVVLGARQPRSALKEVVKREVPSAWQYVLRVGWMRVASLASFGDSQEETLAGEHRFPAADKAAVVAACHGLFSRCDSSSSSTSSPRSSSTTSTTWTLFPRRDAAVTGADICDAVDQKHASMLLPRHLWEKSHVVGVPRGGGGMMRDQHHTKRARDEDDVTVVANQ